MSTFTFGADPEIFLKKRGKPASAYGLIPGDKKNPHKTAGGAIQVDGMAAEFNIDPVPQNNFELFNARIVNQISEIRKRVEGHSLNISPVQDFDEDFLAAQPDEAKELGCDPDYCAYTLAPNPRPDGDRPFRTGAGHVHIGWGADIPVDNQEHLEICANFVKVLDATVGLFMTLIDPDPRRRELYGKAGAFRPKPYGVEYRTPSNVWIKKRDDRRAIFILMKIACYLAASPNWNKPLEEELQKIINTGDREKAKQLLLYNIAFARRVQDWRSSADQSSYAWAEHYIKKID